MAETPSAQGNEDKNKGDQKGPTYPGLFNFQSVIDKFYEYEPGGDDDEGRAMKNAFASNMVQSAFDKEMAKEMGEYQNALGQSNMQLAAQLEMANNSSMMQQEFNYGMQSMGAQFDFQNEFANAQFDRDIATLAATGEDTRKTQDNASYNNRLQAITESEQRRLTDTNRAQTEGEQARLNAQVAGGEQRLTDTNRAQVQGAEARETQAEAAKQAENLAKTQSELAILRDTNQLRTSGEETRATAMTQGEQQRLTDTNKLLTQGSEQRLTDTNRLKVTGDEERKNIAARGEDTRTTMDFGNRLESRTRAEQSKYSRNNARSF